MHLNQSITTVDSKLNDKHCKEIIHLSCSAGYCRTLHDKQTISCTLYLNVNMQCLNQ